MKEALSSGKSSVVALDKVFLLVTDEVPIGGSILTVLQRQGCEVAVCSGDTLDEAVSNAVSRGFSPHEMAVMYVDARQIVTKTTAQLVDTAASQE